MTEDIFFWHLKFRWVHQTKRMFFRNFILSNLDQAVINFNLKITWSTPLICFYLSHWSRGLDYLFRPVNRDNRTRINSLYKPSESVDANLSKHFLSNHVFALLNIFFLNCCNYLKTSISWCWLHLSLANFEAKPLWIV